MSQPVKVSVVVLTWNGLEVTRNCMTTLLGRTDHPCFEVVAVDNGSTDGTLEYLRSLEGIRLVENGENLGFVGGNNAGIRACEGDVVLLNNDTEIVRPDWLKRMQETAYSSEDIGIVGCRLVNGEGRLVHAGTYMPVPSFWGQEYPGDEKDVGQYTDDAEVEGVIAACMYIKREVLDRVGPLDEDYFSYFEDTDYCLKAADAGFKVFRCGGATVKHLENVSTDLNRMDFSGTFRRSRETFLAKWRGKIESRYTRRLAWRSYISTDDPFSRANRKLLWALERAGVYLTLDFLEGRERAELDDFRINDMKNRGDEGEAPLVFFGPPEEISTGGRKPNVAWVSTRYDRFASDLVRHLNSMDEVWVPSNYQKEVALASGVSSPVSVVPLGVDPDYFHPGIASYPLEGRFAFLAPVEWGSGWASEALVRAFTDEFASGEKVVLVMLVTTPEEELAGGKPSGYVEQEIEALRLRPDRAPVVFVMDHRVPTYQLGCLYRSTDCLVLVPRGDYTGTALSEALACGRPVIAPGRGSSLTEVDERAVFGVEYAPALPGAGGLAEPDYRSLRAVMRRVFGDSQAERNALAVSESIRSERSWDRIARMITERLDGACGG